MLFTNFYLSGKLSRLENIKSKTLFKTIHYLTWNLNSGSLFWWKKHPTLPMYGGFSISRKYRPNKVLVWVLDLNQNSGSKCTLKSSMLYLVRWSLLLGLLGKSEVGTYFTCKWPVEKESYFSPEKDCMTHLSVTSITQGR